MIDQSNDSPSFLSSIWTNLIGRVSRKRNSFKKSTDNDESELSAVERQTENSRKGGTIWEAVRKADEPALKRLLNDNPNHADARGPVGECPIHMLFLYGTESHLNMARYVITNFPYTITQIYNQAEYYGEMPLHIAIIKRNPTMVEWLLGYEHNKDYIEQQLTAAASGNFFKVGRPCYYGETPLAFACCTNQWNIAEILLKYGASMDAVDSNGNNVLHLLVIHNLPEMYTTFKQRWLEEQGPENESNVDDDDDDDDEYFQSEKKRITPLWKRLNKDGYTPLTLAAKLGQADMFSFLLEERKITQWSFGPVACVLYPLDQVDLDFREDNLETPPCALELIVQNAHVELIMHPRMIDLINKKWERFARRIFFNRFLITLCYMLIFLVTTILDQTRTEVTEGEGDEEVTISVEPPGLICQTLCTIGRLLVLAGAIWKGKSEFREINNIGIRKYFQTAGSGFLENCLACLFCTTIYIVNIFRLLNINAELPALAIASLLGWGYMLFFVMAFRLTGPFVVMIYEMLLNDVLRFCIIYVVFLVGFSQTFFILFNYNGFLGFVISVKQCFLGMLGDFDLDAYTSTEYAYINVLILIFYIIVVTILLLNLLVAMMGDTYGNIIEDATQVWHLERARIVFAIENEMDTEQRILPINKYWTNIDGERYLQVEEVNEKDFLTQNTNVESSVNNDQTNLKKQYSNGSSTEF
ncbi:unnamed protein product [Rotaria sp. Silwood1]|nr:unnamed protein product [Rotaria sp. Silwood1]CAF1571710.1 unnamed protein product [Rotaria sp. Silwood1]CAF3665907.1 unnamed protein product [Rotaria sp. Silwood1]CAF3697625.1 unnamed protein product [Rotaria sp. Silwood1]CAF4891768.1 unnamed protein product [Rotaria sp. Silwood1]